MANKHTVNYHPSPSQLTSKIHSHISIDSLEQFISLESLLNIFLNLYILPSLQKSFKFMVVRFWKIHLWVCSLNLFKPPKQKEIIHSSKKAFSEDLFFPQKKGEGRIMGSIKWPKLNLGGYCSRFDKGIPPFLHLYIFGLCFV